MIRRTALRDHIVRSMFIANNGIGNDSTFFEMIVRGVGLYVRRCNRKLFSSLETGSDVKKFSFRI